MQLCFLSKLCFLSTWALLIPWDLVHRHQHFVMKHLSRRRVRVVNQVEHWFRARRGGGEVRFLHPLHIHDGVHPGFDLSQPTELPNAHRVPPCPVPDARNVLLDRASSPVLVIVASVRREDHAHVRVVHDHLLDGVCYLIAHPLDGRLRHLDAVVMQKAAKQTVALAADEEGGKLLFVLERGEQLVVCLHEGWPAALGLKLHCLPELLQLLHRLHLSVRSSLNIAALAFCDVPPEETSHEGVHLQRIETLSRTYASLLLRAWRSFRRCRSLLSWLLRWPRRSGSLLC
mmetsp:Transcript_11675/g.23401  ORF Transcript_11675/g.23401 Transcript_11675/m.23401 type:complete len:287 (-) Transcript_11675:745-1605(-)